MTPGDLNNSPAPSRNNTAKWVALGCGGCLGLTVLFAVLLGVFISRTMRFALEPEAIEAQSQDLFTYSLPGGSKGILSLELFGLQISQVATLESPPSALLTVGKVPAYLEPEADQEAFADALLNQVTLEGTYQLLEQRTEDRTLCDQPVKLLVQEGRYQNDQTRTDAASYFTVVDYNNQTRFAWILAQGATPLQTADQVFDSLQCQ
jgi:hypothetical protein